MIERDQDALTRALDIANTLDPAIVQAVETMLKTSTWQEAAEYAVYHCQMRSLHLRPWMCPPCDTNDEIDASEGDRYGNRASEIELRQRLKRAGLSAFEPDPAKAIAEIEAQSAASPSA